MAYSDQDITLVRQSTDIVALIGEHISLKKTGRRWVGVCPFHDEKTPSFSVNAEEGLYYCFGCHASGDAITFIRQIEHLDFTQAVQRLAEKAHVTIEDVSPQGASKNLEKRAEMLSALERACIFYHDQLLKSPEAKVAREYLESRKIDQSMIERFRLGFSPVSWDGLEKALKLDRKILVSSGLGFINRRGNFQDSMMGRLIFPICDSSGKVIAFGGRIIPGLDNQHVDSGAKYKNSIETSLYSKKRTLFGLDLAKRDIAQRNEIVVCEGYTDVIALASCGIERAVATCGTALGEEHVSVLRRFAPKIIFAFDSDSAGAQATERVYEWEQRFKLDVYVAQLPLGQDPGSLAQSDPESLRDAIDNAVPFLGFLVGRFLSRSNLKTIEGRTKAFQEIVPIIARHPSDMVRDQYLAMVAEQTGLHLDRAREALKEQIRKQKSFNSRPANVAPLDSRRSVEPSKSTRSSHDVSTTTKDSHEHSAVGKTIPNSPDVTSSDLPQPASQDAWHEPSQDGAAPSHLMPNKTPKELRLEDEALCLLIEGDTVLRTNLVAPLFDSPLHRSVFEILVSVDFEVNRAMDLADDLAGQLISRLATKESSAQSHEVWRRLVEQASVRSMEALDKEIARNPARFSELEPLKLAIKRALSDLRDLKNIDSSNQAADSLLGWIIEHDSGEMFVI